MTTRQERLNPVDVLVLRAVNRFRYLTAAQLNRLLWPNNIRDQNREAQRRLKTLADAEYLQAVSNLPRPVRGTAPRVYVLGRRGRRLLQQLGETVPSYYRPSETREALENPLFMPHTLAVIDVLIAAERLTHDSHEIRLTQLVLERELRRLAHRVSVPSVAGFSPERSVTVIPDAV